MEPLFENHFTWTKKALRETYYRTFQPFHIAVAVLVVIVIWLLISDAIIGGMPFDRELSEPLVVLLAVDVFCFLLPLYPAAAAYSRNVKLLGSAPECTVRFFEDHFVYETKQTGGGMELGYAKINRVMETKNLLILMLTGRFIIILGKEGFTRGSAAPLRLFLKEKVIACRAAEFRGKNRQG